MKALILAAGEGTRLRPLTLDRPKPMLPVGGRPIIEHLIALLRHHSVTQVAINLHYKPDVIESHVGDGKDFGVSVTYSYEERLLGSAGAAKRLEWFLDETFIVLYGDVLTDLDITTLVERHRAAGAAVTLALYRVSDPTRCGIVQLAADGRITRFVEKPSREEAFSNLANAGIYIVQPRVLDFIPVDRPFDFGHDLFPLLMRHGLPVYGHELAAYVLDIGSPERYAQAQLDVASGRFRSPSESGIRARTE